MSEIIGPRETQAQAFFCPQCGSPVDTGKVSAVALGVAVPAFCPACGWHGETKDLAVAPFKHSFASDEDVAQSMTRELRNVLAKTAAQSYGSFLLKWGFLDQPITALQLSTYMDAIAKAVVRTIIETRKTLTEERARERAGLSGPTRDQDG